MTNKKDLPNITTKDTPDEVTEYQDTKFDIEDSVTTEVGGSDTETDDEPDTIVSDNDTQAVIDNDTETTVDEPEASGPPTYLTISCSSTQTSAIVARHLREFFAGAGRRVELTVKGSDIHIEGDIPRDFANYVGRLGGVRIVN